MPFVNPTLWSQTQISSVNYQNWELASSDVLGEELEPRASSDVFQRLVACRGLGVPVRRWEH